jgi:hypothetical protein
MMLEIIIVAIIDHKDKLFANIPLYEKTRSSINIHDA